MRKALAPRSPRRQPLLLPTGSVGLNHARLVVRHRWYDGGERFRVTISHRAQHCIGLGPDTSCRDDHFGQPLLDTLAAFLSIRSVEALTLAALAWASHQ